MTGELHYEWLLLMAGVIIELSRSAVELLHTKQRTLDMMSVAAAGYACYAFSACALNSIQRKKQ